MRSFFSSMIEIREMIGGFSGFKGRLLLFAGIVVLAGMAWTGSRQLSDGHNAAQPGFSVGLTTPGVGLTGEPTLTKADQWGAGAVTMGGTFMAAMLAASFLRVAFKTGVVLLLVAALAAWFLESQGYTQVWDDYLKTMEAGGGWLDSRLGAVSQLVKEHLATTAAGLAGFGLGLKR